MWIHYITDGDYESVSNSKRKSVDAFVRNRFMIELQLNGNLKNIVTKGVEVLVDFDSFLTYINMDCAKCGELYNIECNEIYPLEIMLDIDDNFNVNRVLMFVNCEDTRLLSMGGKYNHLKHCVDIDLNNSDYISHSKQGRCNKNKIFKDSEYEEAYIYLKDVIVELCGDSFYSKLYNEIEQSKADSKKIGKLF